MTFFPGPWVRRRSDGMFDLAFTSDERFVLRDFLGQMRDLLLGDDPLLRRLFPPAYLDDPEHDRDYQELMKGELIEARFAAIETVEESLEETRIDEATLTGWMQAINALRLVLGTRLDVGEEPERLDPSDPDLQWRLLYETLGHILADIVEALTEALPEPTAEY